MQQLGPTAARLAAAVVTVLAVTVGGPTAPALAAGPAAPVAAEATRQSAPFDLPADSVLLSAGKTGVLSRTGKDDAPVHRWTRLADGVTTTLPAGPRWGSPGTDLAVTRSGTAYTLTDLSGAADPVVIDVAGLAAPAPYSLRRVVGDKLLMSAVVDGLREYHLVSRAADGTIVDTRVAVPAGLVAARDYSSGPDSLAVFYRQAGPDGTYRNRLGRVDVATGALTESYELPVGTDYDAIAVSPTHLSWVEGPYASTPLLSVVPRATGRTETLPLPSARADDLLIDPSGDWVTYAKAGGGGATYANPLFPLTARSLTGRESFPLLDHVSSAAHGGDGGLLVLGGTVARGEGLYRVAPDPATGRPAATLVRGYGAPTALTAVKETLPPTGTLDFDRAGGRLAAGWTLSRFNATATLTLTHKASGRTVEITAPGPVAGVTDFPLDWNGRYDDGLAAHNGAYTWTMRATPVNGVGPAVERTGSFTLTRATRLHDYDGNGSPDVLARSEGYLGSYDVRQVWGLPSGKEPHQVDIGGGWNVYDRIVATGDLGGTGGSDLVARDGSGVLWFYEGTGGHRTPFAGRTRIGGGWGIYDRLTGGSDLTGDGRADLLATDGAGTLWLYRGTGNAGAPFAGRTRIGGGWGSYDRLTATGDLAGAAAGDLVARDEDGVLWLYLGKGDGTFAPRVRVGGGWGKFRSLVGIGDVDGDGRNDLLAESSDPQNYDTVLHLYRGTGGWRAPFAAGETNHVEQRAWIGDLS